jgi:hypothetical protein
MYAIIPSGFGVETAKFYHFSGRPEQPQERLIGQQVGVHNCALAASDFRPASPMVLRMPLSDPASNSGPAAPQAVQFIFEPFRCRLAPYPPKAE